MYSRSKMVEALVMLFESVHQAPSDFCGEQREFYLPRITKAFFNLGEMFPSDMVEAMQQAKDPYGDLVVKP
jgi:hypothetical protein